MIRALLGGFLALSIFSCSENTVTQKTESHSETVILSGENGITYPSGEYSVSGDSLTISAIPDDKYRFVKWVSAGSPVKFKDSLAETTVLTNLAKSGTVVRALFAPKLCTLIVVSDSAFSLSVSDTIISEYESTVSVSAPNRPGYRFEKWSSTPSISCANTLEPTAFVTIRGNGLIRQVYMQTTSTITIDTVSHCSLSVKGTYTISSGDSLVVTCVPENGYRFVQWVQTGKTTVPVGNIFSSTAVITGAKGDGSIVPKVEITPVSKWVTGHFLRLADSLTPLTELFDGHGNTLGIRSDDILKIVYRDAVEIERYKLLAVGNGKNYGNHDTVSTLADLIKALKAELQTQDPAIDVSFDLSGHLYITGNTTLSNIDIKNYSRPYSNNYVSNTFLWSGTADGGSAGLLLSPASRADLLINLYDSEGEPLGLETGDRIRLGGSFNGDNIREDQNGGLEYTRETTTMSNLLEYIQKRIPSLTTVDLDRSDSTITDGSIVITRDPSMTFLLSSLSIGASNSNNNAVTPTAFNRNMIPKTVEQ